MKEKLSNWIKNLSNRQLHTIVNKVIDEMKSRNMDSGWVKLTQAQRSDILTFIYYRKEDGSYFGNKEQYYKRMNDLQQKIESM